MLWATSQGDRLGVAGCSTLGGGATLGGVDVSDIFGVGSDSSLGCWKGSWGVGTMTVSGNLYPTFFGSATCTLLVYFGGAIGGVRG